MPGTGSPQMTLGGNLLQGGTWGMKIIPGREYIASKKVEEMKSSQRCQQQKSMKGRRTR